MLAKCFPCFFESLASRSDSLSITYLDPPSSVVVKSAPQIIVDIADEDLQDLKSPSPPSGIPLPNDRSGSSNPSPNRSPNLSPLQEIPARHGSKEEASKKTMELRPRTEGTTEKVKLKLRNLY
jgi:hypothetical protein